MRRFPADLVRAQTRAVLEAWDMSPEHATITSELMTEADLVAHESVLGTGCSVWLA